VENPLKRYLLNSTILKTFEYGMDGSLTLYLTFRTSRSRFQVVT